MTILIIFVKEIVEELKSKLQVFLIQLSDNNLNRNIEF